MGKSRRLSRGGVLEDATFDENDDEAERNALRAAREAEAELAKSPHVAKQSRPAAGAAAAGTASTDPLPAGGWGEIAELYADCIKMCNDNKVNEKNSWSLNLIDHMGDALAKPAAGSAVGGDDEGVTNFQVASCTLDAGVKIYSYRVDSVYSAAYRVLGGLNRTGAAPADEDEDADGEAADGAGDDASQADGAAPVLKKPARAKPARSAASTLASAASLDGKPSASAAVLDPLLHKMCARFDAGGARGLLLANMALNGARGLTLLFEGEGEPSDAEVSALRLEACAAHDVSALRRLVPSPTALFRMEVASSLVAFVDGKMAELGAPRPEPGSAPAPSLDASETFSGSTSAERPALPWLQADDARSDCGSHAHDEGAELLDDADEDSDERAREAEAHLLGMGVGGDDDDDDGAAADLQLFGAAQTARDSPARHASAPTAAQQRGAAPAGAGHHPAGEGAEAEAEALYDGGEAGARGGAAWAGPAHWRARGSLAQPSQHGGAPAARGQARGGRKERAPMLLDIGSADHAANAAAVRARPVRGSTRITAAALAKAALEPLTLPVDHRIEPLALVSLFARPQVQATRLRPARDDAAEGGGGGRAPGDEDGAGRETRADAFSDDEDGAFGASDGFGFAQAAGDESAGPAVSWADGGDGVPPAQAKGVGGGLSLLAELVTVQPPDVSYAKVAKKVNIRALKESLWHVIDTSTGAPTAPSDGLSFRVAMSSLAASAPAESMRDVSVAYCFICLLHLANEKGLRVEGTEDLTDLRVSQAHGGS